jgi:hypothetical protein
LKPQWAKARRGFFLSVHFTAATNPAADIFIDAGLAVGFTPEEAAQTGDPA